LPEAFERKAVAVEDQFVVATDQIAVDHWHFVLSRDGRQHVVADPLFSEVIRRRGQIQQGLRACLTAHQIVNGAAFVQLRGQIVLRPNVFANRQSKSLAGKIDYRVGVGRLEVAVFIEHVVRRQEHLLSARDDLPILDQRDRIHVVATGAFGIEVHVADQQRSRTYLRRQFIQSAEVIVDEAVFSPTDRAADNP